MNSLYYCVLVLECCCQACEATRLNAAKLGNTVDSAKNNRGNDAAEDGDKEYSVAGEIVQTSTVERPPESTIHTNYDLLNSTVSAN